MAKQVFDQLCTHYPEIIAIMPEVFGSHEFILELAHRYQKEYIEALYAYRVSAHVETPSPFQFVHRELASRLRNFSELVEFVRPDRPSVDIFRQNSACSEWRKIQ